MPKPLDEKAKKLRPLRIVLAVLAVVLVIIVLEKLPTRRVVSKIETVEATEGSEKTSVSENSKTSNNSETSDGSFYYISGLLEVVESQLESRLKSLGVPEEEYKNVSEYLSKDEIFEIETKVTLAASLEEVWVKSSPEELKTPKTIFNLDEDYNFEENRGDSASSPAPSEYKNLSELLSEYENTLTKTEDYDIMVKET